MQRLVLRESLLVPTVYYLLLTYALLLLTPHLLPTTYYLLLLPNTDN